MESCHFNPIQLYRLYPADGIKAYALNCQLLFDNPTQLVEEIKAWLRLMELCIAAAHRTIYRITQFYGLIDILRNARHC